MLEKMYEWIWRRIGGKPWTHIIRDESSKAPLLFFLFFLLAGVIFGIKVKKYWWQILIGFVIGVVVGHIWW